LYNNNFSILLSVPLHRLHWHSSIHSVIISQCIFSIFTFHFVAYFNGQSFVIAFIRNYQICLSLSLINNYIYNSGLIWFLLYCFLARKEEKRIHFVRRLVSLMFTRDQRNSSLSLLCIARRIVRIVPQGMAVNSRYCFSSMVNKSCRI